MIVDGYDIIVVAQSQNCNAQRPVHVWGPSQVCIDGLLLKFVLSVGHIVSVCVCVCVCVCVRALAFVNAYF